MAYQQLLTRPTYTTSFAGMNLDFRSEVWADGDVVASQAFIVSQVGTARGFGILKVAIRSGTEDIAALANNITGVTRLVANDVRRAEAIYNTIRTEVLSSASLIQIHLLATAAEGLRHLHARQTVTAKFAGATQAVADSFRVLAKIASALTALHREYGVDYVNHGEAVMKLTVCMKCLDHVWAEMLERYATLRVVQDEFHEHPYYEFPFGRFAAFEVLDDEEVGDTTEDENRFENDNVEE